MIIYLNEGPNAAAAAAAVGGRIGCSSSGRDGQEEQGNKATSGKRKETRAKWGGRLLGGNSLLVRLRLHLHLLRADLRRTPPLAVGLGC